MLSLVIPLTAVAAFTDARGGLIPNWWTLPALIAALVLRLVVGGMAGLFVGLLGALACGLVPWIMYRATNGKAIGGGDIKLFVASGALVGPLVGLELEISAFILLALLAFVQLAYQGQLLRVLWNALRLGLNPLLPERMRCKPHEGALTEMRMGPAIALAALVVVARHTVLSGMPWPV